MVNSFHQNQNLYSNIIFFSQVSIDQSGVSTEILARSFWCKKIQNFLPAELKEKIDVSRILVTYSDNLYQPQASIS